MGSVLVYSEAEAVRLELLSGGREIAAALGGPLVAALLGAGEVPGAEECVAHGAERVFVGADDALAAFVADIHSAALAQIVTAADASLVLIGSTRRGRTLAPRLAQKLGAGCITDAKHVEVRAGRVVGARFALGGATMKEEAIVAPTSVVAVSPGAFDAARPPASGAAEAAVVPVALELPPSRVRLVERRAKHAGGVRIEEADRLVCIGRGVAKRDDLPMIEALAKALGAETAATRPICYDYGWMAQDRMIGISGKTVSPQLYVLVGSSGQIQHTVSVRGAKVIVAINTDRNAPIFQMADYGIVGDLYDVVPRLTAALAGGS